MGGSVKADGPSSTQEEVVPTPEAIRLPSSPEMSNRRPGEASIPRPASSRRQGMAPAVEGGKRRLRSCAAAMHFVPWWSLLAVALLIGGLVTFALKGKDAADQGMQLLDMVGSEDTGFVEYVSVFKTCYPVTLGVAGGVVAASLLVAGLRLNQRLRREGRTAKQGAWGKVSFSVLRWTCLVLVVFVCLTWGWFLVNLTFLTSWGLGLQSVREGCSVAANTLNKNPVNSTLVNSALVPAQDSVCPATACLNLGVYKFLESPNCICSEQLLASVHELGDSAVETTTYSTIAMLCMLLGAWVATMQMVASVRMMEADQLWLRVVRRRSSSRMDATPPRPIPGPYPYSGPDSDSKKQLVLGASRRLPYGSPPQVYQVHSDSRQSQ